MSASHAPIVFFAYKRADHARTTLEALRRNPEAAHSDLHVFIDGPRSPSDERAIGEVRDLIRGVSGFRSVHVVERQENLGLSRSIVTGVGEVVREAGRVIVIEDDIVTAIRKDMPLDRAALIGCSVMTGVGAVMHTSNVRPGETVAVIGCGGVGLAAINGAAIAGAGASTICGSGSRGSSIPTVRACTRMTAASSRILSSRR